MLNPFEHPVGYCWMSLIDSIFLPNMFNLFDALFGIVGRFRSSLVQSSHPTCWIRLNTLLDIVRWVWLVQSSLPATCWICLNILLGIVGWHWIKFDWFSFLFQHVGPVWTPCGYSSISLIGLIGSILSSGQHAGSVWTPFTMMLDGIGSDFTGLNFSSNIVVVSVLLLWPGGTELRFRLRSFLCFFSWLHLFSARS